MRKIVDDSGKAFVRGGGGWLWWHRDVIYTEVRSRARAHTLTLHLISDVHLYNINICTHKEPSILSFLHHHHHHHRQHLNCQHQHELVLSPSRRPRTVVRSAGLLDLYSSTVQISSDGNYLRALVLYRRAENRTGENIYRFRDRKNPCQAAAIFGDWSDGWPLESPDFKTQRLNFTRCYHDWDSWQSPMIQVLGGQV